jgi:tetratricopeptide (TPR) repeat protein
MNETIRLIPLTVAALIACSSLATLTVRPSQAQQNQVEAASIPNAPGFPGKGKIADWKKATVLFNQGIDCSRSKDYKGAIKKYQAAIAVYPFDPNFFANMGFAYERCSDPKSGEAACRKAVALDKQFGGGYENLGNCLYDQNRLTESKAAFNQAVQCELPLTKRNELLKVIDTLDVEITKHGSK